MYVRLKISLWIFHLVIWASVLYVFINGNSLFEDKGLMRFEIVAGLVLLGIFFLATLLLFLFLSFRNRITYILMRLYLYLILFLLCLPNFLLYIYILIDDNGGEITKSDIEYTYISLFIFVSSVMSLVLQDKPAVGSDY